MATDMADQIDISIVVPVYNGAPYIAKTIPPLATKMKPGMELLLIDDGSTDESGEICLNLSKQYEYVRYVRQENSGVVSARNLGIREAQGTYICFWDQDDYADPDVYQRLCDKMKSEHARMGMCSTSYGTPGNWLPYEQMSDDVFRGERVQNLAYHLLLNGYDYMVSKEKVFFYGTIWKCMFLRSWIQERELQFHVFKHYEDDWLFVLESLLQSDCVTTISDTGYSWYENRNSVSRKRKYQPDFMTRTKAYEEYLEQLLKRWLPIENVPGCLAAIYCNDIIDCLDNLYCSRERETRRREKGNIKQLVNMRRKDGSLQMAEHLKKNVLRRRLTLQGMWKHGAEWGIFLDRLVCVTVRWSSKIKSVRRLERKGKHQEK